MSASQRPRAGNPGEYDGHDDYLEQFEPPSAQQRLRRFCAGLLGIAVGLTVMRWAFNLMDTDPPSMLRIITGPIAFVIGLIAGAFFHHWLTKKTPEGEERTGWSRELIGAALFVLGFLIPVMHNANVRAERYQQSLQEAKKADEYREALLKERMDRGVAQMLADGRHAPPGTLPPGFEVDDRGMSVRVTNVGTLNTEISLSRVIEDAAAPSGWRGCALYTTGPHGEGKYYHHYISAGMSLTFVMYPDCYAEFGAAALEYRVGNPQIEGERGLQAWWSDSAASKPEGREWEFWQRRSAATR